MNGTGVMLLMLLVLTAQMVWAHLGDCLFGGRSR